MILDYITWNVDPELIGFWIISIRYYGVLFAASFFFGYLIMQKMFKKENLPIELLDNLTIYMAIGTVLGARLGHCFFYQPEYYLRNPWEILFIWHGGLASHGAAIGILIALYYFGKKNKKPYLWILDRIVIVVALAGFFIRMGNLMNSEIYGIETSLPWGFIFVRDGQIVPKHPTQIYEALSYLIIFVVLLLIYSKKGKQLKQGLLFGIFLISLFTVRFFIEFIKEVQVDFETGMSLNMGQWLSIPFILVGIFLLFRSFWQPQIK
ncbi:MAG: prolipoprotein diacylglyceryl transferase [Bacteroidetes bacterium GWF2_33_16]|nr:MAG: prolipoprotein diacylglyceryl transferase [Bacteroidetes bacterium GWE2_32_14]OFY04054.1 MAG: prolipoprotein diacylglyceryl transferase [Bacteroidetes bacterium GWF2_33_16]